MVGKLFASQPEEARLTNKKTNKKLVPTRLQLFRLQLRLLGGMLRLAAEGLVVTVLVLAGRVQSLCLASRRDRGVEVKDLRGNKEEDDVEREKKQNKAKKRASSLQQHLKLAELFL